MHIESTHLWVPNSSFLPLHTRAVRPLLFLDSLWRIWTGPGHYLLWCFMLYDNCAITWHNYVQMTPGTYWWWWAHLPNSTHPLLCHRSTDTVRKLHNYAGLGMTCHTCWLLGISFYSNSPKVQPEGGCFCQGWFQSLGKSPNPYGVQVWKSHN